jgi:hypothetical protein
MSDIDELLKRLTERGVGVYRHEEDTGAIQWMVRPDKDCAEATSLIRELQAELSASRAANASEFKRGQEVMRKNLSGRITDLRENALFDTTRGVLSLALDEIAALPIGE